MCYYIIYYYCYCYYYCQDDYLYCGRKFFCYV
jgi:hypothetical protein